MTERRRRLALALGAAVILAASFFQLGYRPWQRSWGASRAEVARPLPGDELVPSPDWAATRAISIRAEPEKVWPWLVQMGYLRAGFYSWDRLDNDGVPSARHILPQYQGLREGDSLPVSADSWMQVRHLEAPRSLLLASDSGPGPRWTWAWGLYPDGKGGTRLVSRLRLEGVGWTTRLLLDGAELVMMRRHLRGIRDRVEGQEPVTGSGGE